MPIATLFDDKKDEEEAEKLLKRGLRVREKVYGDKHPEVAQSWHLLGNHAQHQEKDFPKAEALYNRALKMREQYYLRHSDRVAQTLNCIAQLKNKQGDEAKAEEILIETLTIRREISTEQHYETQKTAESLLLLYKKQLKKLEAAGSTEEAEKKRREMRRIGGDLAAWRRESPADGGASFLHATVRPNPPFTNVPAGFKLLLTIKGDKNYKLSHIEKESKAKRVRVEFGAEAPSVERQPSGYTPTPEALASLELQITASSEDALEKARRLCEAHLKECHQKMLAWSSNGRRGPQNPSRARSERAPPESSRGGLTLADFVKEVPAKKEKKHRSDST